MPCRPLLRTITRKKKTPRQKDGELKANQGRCGTCKSGQTTLVCGACTDMTRADAKQYWFCSTGKNPKCFQQHLTACHSNKNCSDNGNESDRD